MNSEVKQRFDAWWKCERTDRPLIRLIVKKDSFDNEKAYATLQKAEGFVKTNEDYHINADYLVARQEALDITHDYYFDSFKYIDVNIGPGSMATYLGSTPEFSRETVWYNEVDCNDLAELSGIGFENCTLWWNKHLTAIKRAVELSRNRYNVCIPDIQENLDILSALRGAENLCFDLSDEPETVKKIQAIIDRDFYKFYNEMYELVKDESGASAFTAFSIWGRGKTAKIQCDFSSLISTDIFDEYVLPSLKEQCSYLDNSLYHLDGKDAIRHLKSVLSIEKLQALQWSPGAGQSDGGSEEWFKIYDAARDAGKAIWAEIYEGSSAQMLAGVKRLIKRYGSKGLYILINKQDTLTCTEGQELVDYINIIERQGERGI